jgi:hypothetical protein
MQSANGSEIKGDKMKILPLLITLLLMTTVSYAVTYKWEDANGMHFTDNAESVPAKYRANTYEAARADANPLKRQGNVVSEQKISDAASRAYAQQNQQAVDGMKRQQVIINDQFRRQQSAKMASEVLQPLAKFMVFWMMFGAIALTVWIGTLVDIIRSEFANPSNKIVWVLLVLGIAPLGIILYFLIGLGQKTAGRGEFRGHNKGHNID